MTPYMIPHNLQGPHVFDGLCPLGRGQPPHPGSPYARPRLAKSCPPLKSQLTSRVRVSSSELLLVLLLAVLLFLLHSQVYMSVSLSLLLLLLLLSRFSRVQLCVTP